MDLQKIKYLLDKYMEAETTLEEELLLKEFFLQKEIPQELLSYRTLFSFYENERLVEEGVDFDNDSFENPVLEKIRTNQKAYKRKHFWSHAAAIAVLMLGTYVPARQYYQKQQAKIAYQETLKAFALLADNYKKATAAVEYLEEFEAAKTKIYNP